MSTSAYTSLVVVDFTHEYWGTQPFRALRATPLQTEAGLLFRDRPGGFALYFDTNFSGRTRSRADVLQEGITLTFRLDMTDPYFYNYTDLPLNTYCFWNETGAQDLHQEASGETRPFFGLLELTIDKDLQANYTARFAAKATLWRYILVGEPLVRLENPSVVDTQTKETFDGPSTVTLRDNRSAVAFTSRNPIALADPMARRFQLLEQGRVVMGLLPGPDVRFISSAIAGATIASEILLY
ncbi:hypothetical protein [Dinghuibacter silviterrae]|uniref:Uncharacterized protein n=1 Tax=Dinghuibacter silviterrae TaxID=1539049 RepID=A0A4R8DUZ4_9BACT|nr:hypothetical protein [Dinghuibacter silviterrae]TDX01285.1 hypothetical protein EDB95_2318 [Dinghuibacter silviterrae]